jgi:hypothetical protein
MDDRAVLNVRAAADNDIVDVAAHGATVPDARFISNDHIADNKRVGGDKDVSTDLRGFPLIRQELLHIFPQNVILSVAKNLPIYKKKGDPSASASG